MTVSMSRTCGTADGNLLTSATFTNESRDGWQEVTFDSPIAISAGKTYVASYHTSGHYSYTHDYFNGTQSEGHLSTQSAAGVFAYGTEPVFPSESYRATNYLVDVVFNAPLAIKKLTLDSGNGTLVDNLNGTWTYTPAADDDSEASFSYTASDGLHLVSSTASLDITGTNDAPTLGFVQGFEANDAGILDGDSGWYGNVQIVDRFQWNHRRRRRQVRGVDPESDDTGPFTRFDGYRSDFVEGLTSEVKVYLNTDWTSGEGFDYSVAASGADGSHLRDFIFHVAKDSSTAAFWSAHRTTPTSIRARIWRRDATMKCRRAAGSRCSTCSTMSAAICRST